ncbi:MAG: hypothetical protein PWR10_648 [Halanaerobiales bacterium]|nr:hypothetical protein [Halanaerobiales bacterium]
MKGSSSLYLYKLINSSRYEIITKKFIKYVRNNNNDEIIIFGAGNAGKIVFSFIQDFNNLTGSNIRIKWFMDNSQIKWGKEVYGKKIIKPQLKKINKVDKVVIASTWKVEIEKQLINIGVTKTKIIPAINTNGNTNLDKIKKFLKYLFKSIKNDLSIIFGIKEYPKVVNFPITSLCNCRCKMCNVWKRENREEHMMTPEEIGEVFSNELFKEVVGVGLSGGEPFLRKDILDVIKFIINSTPKLKWISIISNGLLKNKILEVLPKIEELCRKNNIDFSIMFSLDGIGEVHNKIRGNRFSFDNLNALLDALDNRGFDYSLSTTIVKDNIHDLYNVLNYAKDRGKYIKFRIATQIDRLYNADLRSNFEFNREEKIKIAKFLEGLINNYESKIDQKIFYKSLIDQLIENKPRGAGCDWKNRGISLDPEGNLYYCFTKSPLLGNALKEDLKNLYFLNVKKRKDILKNHCDYCIHDYNGIHNIKTILKYKFRELKAKYIKKSYRLLYYLSFLLVPILKHVKSKNKNQLGVAYITGWYGTETLGDKAILGGIIRNLIKINSNIKLNISSIVPYYTEETMKMIKTNNNNEIFGKGIKENIKKIKESDVIIMGGGPLMDIENLNNILFTFILAKLFRKKTVIYNCGLGPLKSNRLKNVVKFILQLSDLIMLRDDNSAKSYPEIIENINYSSYVDPAVNYLLDYVKPRKNNNSYILFSIRDWPLNYCKNKNEYINIKDNFIDSIIKLVEKIINEYKKEVRFFPMHTYFLGNDDRNYFFELKKKLPDNELIKFYGGEYSVEESIKIFQEAEMLVGMRFHSVVFGNTLGIPTLAIDYDSNIGKIYGFNEIIDNTKNCINIKEVSFKKISEMFDNIYLNKSDFIKKHLKIKSKLEKLAKVSDKRFKEFVC